MTITIVTVITSVVVVFRKAMVAKAPLRSLEAWTLCEAPNLLDHQQQKLCNLFAANIRGSMAKARGFGLEFAQCNYIHICVYTYMSTYIVTVRTEGPKP